MRRRYAGRAELADLITRRLRQYQISTWLALVACVLDELADLGVDVDGLVKLEYDEADVATYPPRIGKSSLAERLAASQRPIKLH